MSFLRPLTFTTAFCTAVFCSAALAANSQSSHSSSNSSGAEQANQQSSQSQSSAANKKAQQKMHRSRLAADVLRDTERARQAIASENQADAAQYVDQAASMAGRLDAATQKNDHMVPIYTEWDSTDVIGPVLAEHQHKNQTPGNGTQPNSQNGNATNNENQSGAQAGANSSTPETVHNVRGTLTTVAVDARMADTHLKAAKAAIAQSNFGNADADLRAVQDSVVLASLKSDLPLLKTRENLAIASEAIQNRDYREASAALRSAGNGLKEYAGASGGSNASQAQQLRTQIDSCASQLGSNHAHVQKQVQGWWNQVTAWMHQPVRNQQASANQKG